MFHRECLCVCLLYIYARARACVCACMCVRACLCTCVDNYMYNISLHQSLKAIYIFSVELLMEQSFTVITKQYL